MNVLYTLYTAHFAKYYYILIWAHSSIDELHIIIISIHTDFFVINQTNLYTFYTWKYVVGSTHYGHIHVKILQTFPLSFEDLNNKSRQNCKGCIHSKLLQYILKCSKNRKLQIAVKINIQIIKLNSL